MGKYTKDNATLRTLRGDDLLKEIRRQAKPRRFFWQEKTIRDLVDERRADLVERAADRSAALSHAVNGEKDRLMGELQRQAKPRRFFWQQKTAYDRAMEQRERLTNAAALRTSALAELAAARRDELVKEARRQAKPRRFFWQEKTAYDKLSERRDDLTALVNERTAPVRERLNEQRDVLVERGSDLRDRALEQRDVLAGRANDTLALAAERRDELLKEARRQAKPRRFFWQQKTAYDKAQEHRAVLASLAATQRDVLVERGSELRDRALEQRDVLAERGSELVNTASERGRELLDQANVRSAELAKEARRQAKPRRFFWQEKTAYDRAQERRDELVTKGGILAAAAATAGAKLLEQANERSAELAKEARRQSQPRRFFWQEKTAYDRAVERAGTARESLAHALPIAQNRAESAVSRAQSAATDAIGTVRSSATDAIDTVKHSASDAADSVKYAAQVPGRAVRSGVKAGQRTVRHSVRIVRVFLWAIAIGALIGLLFAPRSGAQLRADLQRAFQDILDTLNPNSNRDTFS